MALLASSGHDDRGQLAFDAATGTGPGGGGPLTSVPPEPKVGAENHQHRVESFPPAEIRATASWSA